MSETGSTAELIRHLTLCVGAKYVLSGDVDRTDFDIDVFGDKKGHSLAVVRPGSVEEVAQVVRIARTHGAPIVPQGGNTGLAGGATPSAEGREIVLSLGRMNRIEAIDPKSRTARVEAGVLLQNLHDAAARQGLMFPLVFGARGSCMIGGNISTNAGGSNVLRYGNTRALVLGLEVVLADGRIMNLMDALYKNNTGYALKDLFIGAEGTLGIVTRAILQLVPAPVVRATALMRMRDIGAALDVLRALQDTTGNAVEAFELIPARHMRGYAALFPERPLPLDQYGDVNILVELTASGGVLAEAAQDGRARLEGLLEAQLAAGFEAGVVTDAVLAQNENQRAAFWHIRESAYEVAVAEGPAIDFDVALPLDRVEAFLSVVRTRLEPLVPGYVETVIAHLGDGNIHYGVVPKNPGLKIEATLKTAVMQRVEDLVRELDGSFSAEHGIGTSKRPSMARQKDPVALEAMRAIKQALDPDNLMNPGKLLP